MRIESESRSNYDLCFCAEPDAPGTFFIGIMGNMGWKLWHGARLLSADEARQLRDELTDFLGEKCQRCAANEHLLYELPGLRDANEALRRDNADLTVQKDRLIAETETLRQRVASLEKDAADLRKENVECAQENHTLNVESVPRDDYEALRQRYDALRAENASMKVDLMNARARNGILIAICSDTNAVSCQCETTAY